MNNTFTQFINLATNNIVYVDHNFVDTIEREDDRVTFRWRDAEGLEYERIITKENYCYATTDGKGIRVDDVECNYSMLIEIYYSTQMYLGEALGIGI